jgi:MFS-type transporter involved in bile tolerance (Atg22 family)
MFAGCSRVRIKMMSIAIFMMALVFAALAGVGIGVGYGCGATFTVARVAVLLTSGAMLGGILATSRVLFGREFGEQETRQAIVGFVLLALLCGSVLAMVFR